MTDFNSFDLLPSMMEALAHKGYKEPTPIQLKAIPPLLEGRDLIGIAQTGTGKTAAFALPILNRLARNKIQTKAKRVRALILTPTRELASQIDSNLKLYGKGLQLFSAVVFGGVAHRPQIQTMIRGIDILVATPGRLLDLMNEGHIQFEQLEVFVLDEADRMLDMGFIRDVKKIIAKLPQKKQTLLFSATMPEDIARLATTLLKDPVRVEATPQATTVEKVEQKVRFIERAKKPLLLANLLKDSSLKSVLVFTRTKHGADRVVRHLEQASISSAAIHGNKSQGARERALGSFRAGKIRVLVATDIAARGIDVSQIGHVINYNLPDDPKSYVHRIGRTARAGREGVAISFCDESELELLKNIEKLIKYNIPVER
ncbi:MAG: DEAD/DEAH box helicase [Oligoflexia bacterium]|nr:DEAD/DEAH box helicase [Oligoflexia bacterium]MBF0367394.1 DEAD/DEAH box helicase [Oligoflexia bacterium]